MAEVNVLGEDPVVRVSMGHEKRGRGQEVLHAAREPEVPVTVAEVGSTGIVGLEPLVIATHGGRTSFYPRSALPQVREIVSELDDGSLPTDGAMAVVEHDPDAVTLPTPENGPLAVGRRQALGASGWIDPTSIADYTADGGFLASDAADRPDEFLDQLRDYGLRGRGRGDGSVDVPVADAWTTARETSSDIEEGPAVVVNANESDPRASMDQLLLESNPLGVLDGALAAAQVIDATNLLVYVNGNNGLVQDRAAEAAAMLTNEADDPIPIEVIAGPDEYKAGEMTMAIEALEGNHRLEARLRPPHPSEEGLYGRPTLIHTPRTFAQISGALTDDGGDRPGSDADPGTRLTTITGDIEAPATVELPTNANLTTIREAVEFDGQLKAACVGGVFGGITRSLDVPAGATALRAAKLGTNGVVELFDEDRCMVSFAGHRASFAEEENCGRCVPCREGTQQLANKLRDVYNGDFDDAGIRELTRVMDRSSICQFGHDAQRPIATAMDEFELEFQAHAEGRCPSGACN